MRNALLALLAIALALGGGAGSVWLIVTRPPAIPSAAGWILVKTMRNPYGRLVDENHFGLPLGVNEGAAFTAFRDDGGEALRGDCLYSVRGTIPPARAWALNAAPGEFISSARAMVEPDGRVVSTVSRYPASGNWLALKSPDAFSLTLILFDTPVTGVSLADSTLPEIIKLACDG